MPHPPEPTWLVDTLRARLGPEAVITDQERLAPRLADWRKVFRGEALAWVRPSTVGEVAEVVRIAGEHGVAIVPQGGNTGLAGGATPVGPQPQILLTLDRMSRIRSLDRIAMTVEVEAGCIVKTVKDAAEAEGRMLPIGFGAEGSATVGGMVSTNAGGVNALRYGTARQLVLGLEVVLADGTILRGLRGLRKDNAGYDWKQLFIGSEGTLGIVTGVLLRLVPRPVERACAWIALDSPERALGLLEMLLDRLGDSMVAFELMAAATLDKAEKHMGASPPLARAPWHVLVEIADSAGALSERLHATLLAAAESGLVDEAVPAVTEAQRERFWGLRERLGEAELMAGPSAKHDVSVGVSDVPAFLEAATDAVAGLDPGLSVNAYGHMADGNIHFNVMLEGQAMPMDRINQAVHDVVAAFHGSIAAEHGIGQSRIQELARLKDPGELAVLQTLKDALDPQRILNPGKVLAAVDA